MASYTEVRDWSLPHYLTSNLNRRLLVDLKPENLLFRTKAEDADIMIADFGLSRVMDEEKFQLLHEVCGTPGVSAECFYWSI